MKAHSRIGLSGHVIDSPRWGELRSIRRGAVMIEDGRIAAVGTESDLRRQHRGIEWREWPPGSRPLILPGLIDLHAHVPQYPAVARPAEGLLPWLQKRIFPLEREFRPDRALLLGELDAFFAELAAHGTTTAMLYAAVWGESCQMAFEAADCSGLRVIMGKAMMDVGSYGGGAEWPQPKTAAVSLAEADWLAGRWHGADGGRLEYAVSPRFALACSRELLREAARLAARHGCYVQTHLSENRDEVAAVAQLFPECDHYTDVYHAAGLLGPGTVLGHCIHLSDAEIRRLSKSRAAVAHCPTSNFFLGSGLCPIDRLRAAGLRIGLGSDVGAGPELDLWRVMRAAIETQQARRAFDESIPELTPAQAFYLATRGGAEALGKETKIGLIERGFEADVLVINLNAVLPYGGRFVGTETQLPAEEAIALCVYRAGPVAVMESRVRGRITHSAG